MEIKTLHLWRIKHSYTWREGPRGDEHRLDNLVTLIATSSNNAVDAIKLAEMEASRNCKRIDIREVKNAGFVVLGHTHA